eukprot:GHVU01065363.1.p1 GENE.GHVU01065363.1~~GHVU01065363.1.p1  ORF type:complete len:449 (+),score=34.39 GHVU01065363.1:334-1680(+)
MRFGEGCGSNVLPFLENLKMYAASYEDVDDDFLVLAQLSERDEILRELLCDDFVFSTPLVLELVALMLQEHDIENEFHRERMSWERHVAGLLQEVAGGFERYYRMSYDAFVKLSAMLDPLLPKDARMAYIKGHSSVIDTNITLHCLLRWLAGGSYLDIRLLAGVSVVSFYRAIHAGMNAVCACEALAYRFPQTPQEVEHAASQFRQKSDNDVIKGCVATVDGWLLRVQTPAANEVGNVKSFFSGHYQAYGVNVQVACDHRSRFVSVCVAKPGGTNDVVAYEACSMRAAVDALPPGRYIIADNAYVPTEHILTPFSGCQKNNPANDAYNFSVSQLRIKAEQGLGFLVAKFRLFRTPLQVKMRHVGKVVMTGTRVHNYVINERDRDIIEAEIDPIFTTGTGRLGYVPADISVVSTRGTSIIRNRIVQEIEDEGLGRPLHNMQRNAAWRGE